MNLAFRFCLLLLHHHVFSDSRRLSSAQCLYLKVDKYWETWPPEFPIRKSVEFPFVLASHENILCLFFISDKYFLQRRVRGSIEDETGVQGYLC